MKNEMNHDASLLLDENPLPNLIIIHVKADRNSPAQISEHSQGLKKLSGVETVDFKEADLKLLDKIISKLTLAGFILIAFLFLVTIYIIASTIRLAIFSQRFIIRSMQLVGATRWFIVRPFVHKSIFNGVLSGLCASAMITGLYFLIEYYFPSWNVFQPIMYYVISLVLMIIVGVILTVLSSLIMVRRYLRMKLDELY